MIEIRDKQECCGCEACAQVCHAGAITLLPDSEGFLYPTIDKQKCNNCGVCESVCPVINRAERRTPLSIHSAINQNETVREESSSGGVFSLLAQQTLEGGGVVYGVKYGDNFEVIHSAAKTLDEARAFRGSKYVQSRLHDCFPQVRSHLKSGHEVLFSGTPCQVAALKLYLRRDYPKLTLVDFICHGVPSPLVWQRYLGEIKAEHGPIKRVNLRDKRHGWRRYGVAIEGTTTQGEAYSTYEKFFKNPYIRGFLNDLYLRPSCYTCPTKSFRSGSDITIADYWGVEQQQPEMDDDKGTSLVMIHTPKGEALLQNLKCSIQVTTTKAIKKIAHSSPRPHRKRKEFFKHLSKEDISIAQMVATYTKRAWYKKYTRKISKLATKLLAR